MPTLNYLGILASLIALASSVVASILLTVGLVRILLRWRRRRFRVTLGRMMIAIAAVALAVGAITAFPRWRQRRQLLHRAQIHDATAGRFVEAYEADLQCYERGLRGESCGRCVGSNPADSHTEAMYFLRWANHHKAMADAYRHAADDPDFVIPMFRSPE